MKQLLLEGGFMHLVPGVKLKRGGARRIQDTRRSEKSEQVV